MAHNFICNEDTAVVQTKQGKVRGYIYDDVTIFKGIPYAKAARFHAPHPLKPWKGVMETTSYGYVCPLLELPKPTGELSVPHRYWVMNEDCQNLNIWTPCCDAGKRPVLVWLHGGGYESGSAIEHIAYDGENMCRIGQAVVVSVNHRLNLLGYFDLSAYGEEYADSGNAGTQDLVAALKWIQDNIENFGGDPGNVTLFGQSGGGDKVTSLLQTPAADGLYAKGVNMSGVLGHRLSCGEGDGQELAIAIMAELGIDDDIKELEAVPYAELAQAYLRIRPEFMAAGKYIGCAPYPNAFYKGSPETVGFRGETAHIPLLVGTVYGEFSSFLPSAYKKQGMTDEEGVQAVYKAAGAEAADKLLPYFREAYPQRNPVDLLALDFLFRHPAQQFIRQRSALNHCTYSYLFNQDLPLNGGTPPWHCADIPFVFHNTGMVSATQKEGVTDKLEAQIFGSIIAFAFTGDPNHIGIPQWPASSPQEEQTMVFGEDTKLRCNFDAQLVPLAERYLSEGFEKMLAEHAQEVQH